MLVFVIEDQPHRTGTDLRRKLVACLLVHGSTFSGVVASGKPGAVQSVHDSRSLILLDHLVGECPGGCHSNSIGSTRMAETENPKRLPSLFWPAVDAME